MNDLETLLDTPKRNRLQAELGGLRTDLKTFERTFAETYGKKPKQSDIKNDREVAAKYKRYHRLQEVVSGKITLNELNDEDKQSRNKSEQSASGIREGRSQKSLNGMSTPRKSRRNNKSIAPSSISPKAVLIDAVGPTPHRDGKVLGLFDLLQRSGSATLTTSPASSARKRKIEELYSDTPVQRSPFKSIQPRAANSSKREGDLLEFLTGTPQKIRIGYTNERHSRTPQSDGRKFALSQLFATPSTQRFLRHGEDEATEGTPLRSQVFGATPSKNLDTTGLDATPAYLRRSTSFKDRLLSAASSPTSKQNSNRTSMFRPVGPPTLRHFRSSTSNILAKDDPPKSTSNSQVGFDGDEDDWAALQELEHEPTGENALVEDSQFDPVSDTTLQAETGTENADAPRYKKKGQKRTTKKSNIKPVMQKKADEPHFVAADNDYSEAEDDLGEESESGTGQMLQNGQRTIDTEGKTETGKVHGASKTKQRTAGRINPNAQSHQNFRSLKIKNKNSKAKGSGRGRFTKGRR